MPRPKRWFHVNQDINFDPEFEILCKQFGLAGVRFFLQAMSILDKTENHWSIHKDFDLNVLARCCGTKPKMILGSYQLLIDMKWISVGFDVDGNQFIFARNFAKYRGNRVHEKNMTKTFSCSPPSLPIPSLPLKEKKEEKPNPSTSKKKSQGSNTREITKEFLDQLKNNPAYQDLDLDKEFGKCKGWMLANGIPGKPSKKRLINWLNKANPTFKGGSANGRYQGNIQGHSGQGQGPNNGQPRKYDFLRKEAAERRAKMQEVDGGIFPQLEHLKKI